MEKTSRAYLKYSVLSKLFINILIYTNVSAYFAVNHSHETSKRAMFFVLFQNILSDKIFFTAKALTFEKLMFFTVIK